MFTTVSWEDLAEIRKYHDGLRKQNQAYSEALAAIASHEKPKNNSYKHSTTSLQYIAQKAIEDAHETQS